MKKILTLFILTLGIFPCAQAVTSDEGFETYSPPFNPSGFLLAETPYKHTSDHKQEFPTKIPLRKKILKPAPKELLREDHYVVPSTYNEIIENMQHVDRSIAAKKLNSVAATDLEEICDEMDRLAKLAMKKIEIMNPTERNRVFNKIDASTKSAVDAVIRKKPHLSKEREDFTLYCVFISRQLRDTTHTPLDDEGKINRLIWWDLGRKPFL
ncbi:MAG: hypothetical protein WCG05_02010 [Alphaproteobacteria bacterium]